MRIHAPFQGYFDDVLEPPLLDDHDLLVDAQPREPGDDDDDDEVEGELPDRFEYDRRSDRERREMRPVDEYSYFGAGRARPSQGQRGRPWRRDHRA